MNLNKKHIISWTLFDFANSSYSAVIASVVFPVYYANVIVGILIFIVGFIFHWIGQLISVINWDFATKIGFQEKKLLPEYKVYEHAIAVADVMIGWILYVNLLLPVPLNGQVFPADTNCKIILTDTRYLHFYHQFLLGLIYIHRGMPDINR